MAPTLRPLVTEASPSRTSGTVLVWQYLMLVWRRSALSTVIAGIVTPLLYLLALGFGLGTLVNSGPGAASLGGVSYVKYLAPALVTAAALQAGVGEAAYPVYSRFKWSRVFWGISSTPVSTAQITNGQLLFLATRLAIGSALYYVVVLVFGAAGGWAGLLVIPIAVLTGASCAVWVMALAGRMRREGTAFNVVFRFVVVPMTLFSGSFFPIERMPGAIRWLAYISPLWHGNELARAAMLGTGSGLAVLGHLVFLVVLGGAGLVTARHAFSTRLIV
ncbi:lipooligosaccharide transport system permease protein [Nakamurella sp. UYEF19]|uniref:ABC transporter permease n=1 Tax=Nakamurella sp. UYEF19 TaxID=1756392 RepID=UPI00339A38B0